MRYLAVKNWRQFQHYSDRRPPWIKLYIGLLDDLEFEALSESAQLGLIRIWLLAGRLGHPLPNDAALIFRRASVKPKTLKELVSAGWLITTNDASGGDSTDDSGSASPLTRASARSREGEGEGEVDTPPPAAHTGRIGPFAQLTAEQRQAWDAYATEHRDVNAFTHAVVKLATPISGNGFGWPVVGQALVEMRANGKEWSTALCAGYCKRIARGPMPDAIPINTGRRGSTKQAQNLAGIAEGLRILESQEAAHGIS